MKNMVAIQLFSLNCSIICTGLPKGLLITELSYIVAWLVMQVVHTCTNPVAYQELTDRIGDGRLNVYE